MPKLIERLMERLYPGGVVPKQGGDRMRKLAEREHFDSWLIAGLGGSFMGHPVKDMTRDELIAVFGYYLLREKRDRETAGKLLRRARR